MKKTAMAAVGVLAVGVLALAQVGKNPQPGAQSPSYRGSIPVQENLQGEGNEAQAYQALAKVTAQEAVKAAQQALGTTASPTQVSLGNENGYLVWEVVLAGQELKVDAGTGQVLHQEAHGQEEAGKESEDTSEGE